LDIKKFWSKLDNILCRTEDSILIIGMITITSIVFTSTMLRYLLGMSLMWSEEISRAIMIWIVFFGASACLRGGNHVNMDIFLKKIPEGKLKYFIIRLITLTSFIFSLFLVKWGITLTKSVWITGQVTPTLEVPMFFIYAGMPLGAFLLAKNFLHLFVLKLRPKPTEEFKIDITSDTDIIDKGDNTAGFSFKE